MVPVEGDGREGDGREGEAACVIASSANHADHRMETVPVLSYPNPLQPWPHLSLLGGIDSDSEGDSDSDSEGDSSYTTVKPMRRGQLFVDSGHVKNVSDILNNDCYFIRAEVLPSMRNDPPKHVHVCLSCKSGSVLDASCDCKASALGRCSHVSALLLFLDGHVKQHGNDSVQSCTSLPCR